MKVVLAFCLILLCSSQQVFSHPMPKSNLDIRYQNSSWSLNITLPEHRLRIAMKKAHERSAIESNDVGRQLVSTSLNLNNEAVSKYVFERIRASSNDTDWTINILSCDYSEENHGQWVLNLALIPPEENKNKVLDLHYGVITDEIITDKVSTRFTNMTEETQLPLLHGRKKQLTVSSS